MSLDMEMAGFEGVVARVCARPSQEGVYEATRTSVFPLNDMIEMFMRRREISQSMIRNYTRNIERVWEVAQQTGMSQDVAEYIQENLQRNHQDAMQLAEGVLKGRKIYMKTDLVTLP